MNNTTMVVVTMGLVLGASLAGQDVNAEEALAQKYGCMACHGIDNKIVGPSYKEVAAKYKDDPQAIETLTKKVRDGGAGVWGEIPMPPNTAISDEDLKKVLEWILSL